MTIFTVLAWTLSFRWCFIFYFGGGKFNSYQLMEGVWIDNHWFIANVVFTVIHREIPAVCLPLSHKILAFNEFFKSCFSQ